MRNLVKVVTKKLLDGIKRWWLACALRTPVDFIYASSLLIAILLVLGMGPTIQEYLAGFVISTEANIYDAAYKNAIQRFSDYAGWLAPSIDPGVLFPGIAIWCAVLASSHARTALIRGYAAAVISITMADMLLLAAYGPLTMDQILTCVVSNIIGGFFVVLIVVLMRCASTYVAKFETKSSATLVMAVGLPMGIGAAISGTVFVAAKTLYDPTPVDFKATISPKSWGYIRSKMPLKGSDGATAKDFQFFDQTSATKNARWIGMSTPLTIRWESKHEHAIKIYLFEGCGFDTSLPDTFNKPFMRISGIRDLNISIDKGLAEYTLLEGNDQKLSVTEEKLSSITIDRKNDETIFTLHASKESTLTHAQSGKNRLFVSSFLIDTERKSKLPWKPRQISFSANGKMYRLDFIPEISHRQLSSTAKCKSVDKQYDIGKSQINVNSPMAGAVFELDGNNDEYDFRNPQGDENKFTSKGANGWLVLRENADTDTDQDDITRGKADFIVLSGKFDELLVSGAAMPTSNVNSLQAFGGATDIEINKLGIITLSGEANALYWNQERLNKTRWEKIDAGWATFLLSWIAGLMFLIYKGAQLALANNYKLGNPLHEADDTPSSIN